VIVVFDTNVWISDLALTSNAGSAIRFCLRERRARIGLPEVVKLETEFHLRTTLAEHIDQIQSSHRQLLAVFGRLRKATGY
jgi:predicted nucleic acid-binding protein